MATFDLEQRTTDFGVAVVRLCRQLSKDSVNIRMIPQVVASAGSVGANYREANDALGKKDFLLRLKIARKEAKEAIHWLEMLSAANENFAGDIKKLAQEAAELRNILSAIITKAQ